MEDAVGRILGAVAAAGHAQIPGEGDVAPIRVARGRSPSEWADGYSQRFGLVYVDFKTQKRTVKESGKWFGRVAADNKLS